MVTQNPYLFGDTIRANITLSDPGASFEDILRAARAACIHDEIMAMPLGYDTPLLDRGASLSGGQRQRIALAGRCWFIRRWSILDEATSALDGITERAVQRELRLRCTRVVIAHRLATVREADLILVLEDGVLVEQGTHAELLAREGVYHRLAFPDSGADGGEAGGYDGGPPIAGAGGEARGAPAAATPDRAVARRAPVLAPPTSEPFADEVDVWRPERGWAQLRRAHHARQSGRHGPAHDPAAGSARTDTPAAARADTPAAARADTPAAARADTPAAARADTPAPPGARRGPLRAFEAEPSFRPSSDEATDPGGEPTEAGRGPDDFDPTLIR